MRLQTTSETLSFVKELEEKSAKFYEDVIQRYSKDEDVFLSFARENRKYVNQIQSSYYSFISDAFESCFAFNLDSDEFTFKTDLQENVSYSYVLAKAIEIEEKILSFYNVAAEQSMSLMADVPRNFVNVAKKREVRISKLKSLAMNQC